MKNLNFAIDLTKDEATVWEQINNALKNYEYKTPWYKKVLGWFK